MNFNSHGDWTREVLSDTDHEGGNKRGGGPSSGNCPESDLPLQGWGVYPAEASPGSSHFSPSRFSSQVPPGFPQNTRTHRDTQIQRHTNTQTPRQKYTQTHPDAHRHVHRCTRAHTQRKKQRHTDLQTYRLPGATPSHSDSPLSAPSQCQSGPLKATCFKK